MAADATWARRYKRYGFNMLATGTDQGILMNGVKTVLDAVTD